MKRINRIIIVASLIFILISQISGNIAESFHIWPTDRVIGNTAPEITVKDMKGKTVALSSFRGKTVMLNFWATWCYYCRKERAHLNDLSKEYKDRDLIILSVSTDKSYRDIALFLKNSPSEYEVLTDLDGRAASAYHVSALPVTYLIDNKGIVQRKLLGYRKWTGNSSKKLIDDLLEN